MAAAPAAHGAVHGAALPRLPHRPRSGPLPHVRTAAVFLLVKYRSNTGFTPVASTACWASSACAVLAKKPCAGQILAKHRSNGGQEIKKCSGPALVRPRPGKPSRNRRRRSPRSRAARRLISRGSRRGEDVKSGLHREIRSPSPDFPARGVEVFRGRTYKHLPSSLQCSSKSAVRTCVESRWPRCCQQDGEYFQAPSYRTDAL